MFSDAQVRQRVQKFSTEGCQSCKAPGPVFPGESHTAYSFIVLTSWKTSTTLSCEGCHRKRLRLDSLATFLLGWWGFPFGLILTPVQLFRNARESSVRLRTGDREVQERLFGAARACLAAEGVRPDGGPQTETGVPENPYAGRAFGWSLAGLLTLGLVSGVGLFYGLKARRFHADNPRDQAGGRTNVALGLSGLGLLVLGMFAFMLATE